MGSDITELTFFPDRFKVSGMLLRTDESKLYLNVGTFAVPIFEQVGVSSTPTGSLFLYGGALASIPGGFLLCDGAAVSETTFADLFAVIAYSFGNPGGGNFNLPDMRSKFPRGAPAATEVGGTGGVDSVTLTAAQSGVPAHGHGVTDPGHTHVIQVHGAGGSSTIIEKLTTAGPPNTTQNTDSKVTGLTVNNNTAAAASASHENRPAFLEVLYIIKT